MIITHGGLEGGYGLYLRDGKPIFVYNFLSSTAHLRGEGTATQRQDAIVVDFAYDGGGIGKGGKITMSANGKNIAEGRLEKTIPVQFSLGEGLDIGWTSAPPSTSPTSYPSSSPARSTRSPSNSNPRHPARKRWHKRLPNRFCWALGSHEKDMNDANDRIDFRTEIGQ